MALIEIRLRPSGPWRAGHSAGDRERVDTIYHSDALYSAVTQAMGNLGWMAEWLDQTSGAELSAVRFSSLFPFTGDTRLVSPPATAWPPSGAGKLYVKAAALVPLEVAQQGVVNESRWQVDGVSGCLLPANSVRPFETSVRSAAAVDRLSGQSEPHRIACLEFAQDAGWWGLIEFAEDSRMQWEPRVRAALRLLADSGFGGERSRGWGRAQDPEFHDGEEVFARGGHPGAWWLLSLFSPHPEDAIDWSRGEYTTLTRGGWTDSRAGSLPKKHVHMIREGAVLRAPALRGRAVNVAPEGFSHPVWRAGFALAVPVPLEVEA